MGASLKRYDVKLSFHFLSWSFRLYSRAHQIHQMYRICPRGHRDAADSRVLVYQRRSLMSEIRDERSGFDGCDVFESRVLVTIAVGGQM
jgi:hypothetical protein